MRPLAADFQRHLALERGLARNTCLAYAGDLEAFLAYCERRRTDPAAAGAQFIEEYLWSLKKERGLGPASIFRKTEAIRAFYRYLRLEGKTLKDPTANFRAPRLPRKIPRFLKRREIDTLLAYPAGASFAGARAAAAVELLYASGMRVSELLGLRLESVNFQQGWLRVFGKGAKERLVPVNPGALARLREYLTAREFKFGGRAVSEELFLNRDGGKLSRVMMWKDIVALGRAAGVEIKPHPHLFRHTFASHLVQGGADLRSVQEMLGHVSLNTTQIYAHVDKGDVKRAHDKFHPDK
ncbi:MAG: tyrosine-type recombinase/integrase [Elusimicrobia bacterium]|nr:tyrosine-type recombinase/integrase [Elusimicrobiota bacterium]